MYNRASACTYIDIILLSCLCMGTQILLGWTHASIVYGAKCMPTTKEELCMHANPILWSWDPGNDPKVWKRGRPGQPNGTS